MIEKLADQIVSRFEELERDMSDPAVIGDRERYAEVGREYQQIAAANALVLEWRTIKDDLEGAREMLDEDGDDDELKKIASEARPRRRERNSLVMLHEPSSKKRSAWRWSTRTPTTTRT